MLWNNKAVLLILGPLVCCACSASVQERRTPAGTPEVLAPLSDYRAWLGQARGGDKTQRRMLYQELIIDKNPAVYKALAAQFANEGRPEEGFYRAILEDADRADEKHEKVLALTERLAPAMPKTAQALLSKFPAGTLRVKMMIAPGFFEFREFKAIDSFAVGTSFIPDLIDDLDMLEAGIVHELFHLLHAERTGFPTEPRHLGQHLWVDGLATFAEQVVFPAAPLETILVQRDLAQQCLSGKQAFAAQLLPDFDDEGTETGRFWFNGGGDRRQPVPERAGYCLGFLIAQKLASDNAIEEMFAWKWDKAGPLVKKTLEEFAAE
ncbi:MAG TPA: DUF2268 domain-containing putative Zn-dependent protease [Elusimicrobiales bacterium]|nr:DUF2268 domain-containing putative Zn-dependent protease [Elusimicrobiales bacterium]